MSAAVIPVEAVRAALMCAVIKQVTAGREIGGKPHARCAAYTAHWLFAPTCADAPCRRQPTGTPPAHFALMNRGDLWRVLERVQCERGPSEVRRTWGAGIRTLRAELSVSGGVLR